MELEDKLAALEDMSSSELRAHWQRLTGEIAPRISPKLLRLALAWELQAEELGGLSRATQQKLDQLGAGKTRTAAATPDRGGQPPATCAGLQIGQRALGQTQSREAATSGYRLRSDARSGPSAPH